MPVQSYRDLEVWRKAMDVAERAYQLTRSFPREELFGLTSQIRRAPASVPANIAEGQGRRSTKEFLHHVSMARGSLLELETHLILSKRVGLLDESALEAVLSTTDHVSRMLSRLREDLEKKL
jgi:four helix bundle protein